MTAALIAQFRAAACNAGFDYLPEHIEADGRIHRFSTNGNRGDKAGWYALHLDGIAGGIFGDWRADKAITWCAKDQLEPEEREQHRQRMQELKEQRQREQALVQSRAAQTALEQWQDAPLASVEHPYLKTKGVEPHGARESAGRLLIPIYDTQGALCNLQTIDAQGKKAFAPDARVKGCYSPIGAPSASSIVVCEGWATAASIHEATGRYVVAAMSAANLASVAQALRAQHPKAAITIAADNDWQRKDNPGLAKATEAAHQCKGFIAVPQFAEGEQGSDFNDLHQQRGLQAVRQCFEQESDPEPVPANVIIACSADIKPEPIDWLWKNWLARGKLHLLAGAPGQGKTTLAMGIAATLSAGGLWPDKTRAPEGSVLIWSGEDDPADTLVPRLMACGAQRTRVFFIKGMQEAGQAVAFDPAKHLPCLKEQIERIGNVSLLIIDPIVSAIGGGADSHKNTETRRALQPLVDLASATGIAILGLTHFSKGGDSLEPALRVIGSVAFTALARVVWAAGKTKNDKNEDIRALALAKSNIGPDENGFQYDFRQTEISDRVTASALVWGELLKGTAREIFKRANEEEKAPSPTVVNAAEFLQAYLSSDEWTHSQEVVKAAAKENISYAALNRARIHIGALCAKEKMKQGRFFWRLPGGPEHLPLPARESETVTKQTEPEAA